MKGKYCTDDGTEIDVSSIPIPALCKSCARNRNGKIACNITRMGEAEEVQNGGTFCCFAYEPSDQNIDEETVLRDMENYLKNKGR